MDWFWYNTHFQKTPAWSYQFLPSYDLTNFTESYSLNTSNQIFTLFTQPLQEAYKDWLCATRLPYYNDQGNRVKPCLEFCQDTNRMCPYLLPQKPYCGQQVFMCPGEFTTSHVVTYNSPHLVWSLVIHHISCGHVIIHFSNESFFLRKSFFLLK